MSTYIIFDMKIKVLNENGKYNIFYSVGEFDTFESISTAFSVPIEYIKKHNGNSLYFGKVLFLPQTQFVCYTVKPFDNIKTIAKKFGTTVEDIIEKNSLSSEYVFIGQKLFL